MSTLSWLPYSLLATFLLGSSLVFYKLPSFKGHSRYVTTFCANIASAILAFSFFYGYLGKTTSIMLAYAAAWGILFSLIVTLQMYALKHVDTNVLFPITTTSSLAITALSGLIIFHDHISSYQLLGIILVIFIVFFYTYEKKKFQYTRHLALIGLGIIVISIANKLIQKVAANNFDVHAFQVFEYIFAAVSSLTLILVFEKDSLKNSFNKGSLFTGVAIGTFGFFGGYFLFMALTRGPFSLVTSIHSLYVLVTATAGYMFFNEKLNRKRVFLILLALVALYLMSLSK